MEFELIEIPEDELMMYEIAWISHCSTLDEIYKELGEEIMEYIDYIDEVI